MIKKEVWIINSTSKTKNMVHYFKGTIRYAKAIDISMIIRQTKVLSVKKKKKRERESLLTNLHFIGNIKLSRKLFPTNFKLLLRYIIRLVIFVLLFAFHNLESPRAWLISLIRHVVFLDFISKVRFTRLQFPKFWWNGLVRVLNLKISREISRWRANDR